MSPRGCAIRPKASVADDDRRYLSGFHAAKFFYPGPAGYDAAFAIRASDMPELADAKFSEPIVVLISGSALLYELDMPPVAAGGQPVAALEDEFPGIRETILEHHLRYTFVRYGVPYAVSVGCFETASVRHKMPSCRMADQVAQRFLRALRVVGGTPRPMRAVQALADRAAGEGVADVQLLRARPDPVRHRLPRQGRPAGLHGLFADPLSAR